MVDRECEFYELISEDLMTSAPLEDKCRLQPYQHGEFDQNTDYRDCNCASRTECSFYLARKK